MRTLIKIVFIAIMILLCVKACEYRIIAMEQYEAEHNCKYDYNDLCYTQEQKPWLYKTKD